MRSAGNRELLVPAAAGAAGVGAVAGQSPVVGAGVGGLLLLTYIPWVALFSVSVLLSYLSRWKYDIGPVSIQPAHPVVLALAIRVFVLTRGDLRPRLRWMDWSIIGFVVLQFVASALGAVSRTESLLAAGLLGTGLLAYLATYVGLCSRRRLIIAARTILAVAAFGAAAGVVDFFIHFTPLGSTPHYNLIGSVPAVGLASEHDVLSSMSASAALAFFVLMREENPVFTHRVAVAGFWTCVGGMLAGLARGSWLGFAVALLVLVVLPRRVPRRGSLTAVALTSLVVAVAVPAVIWATTSSRIYSPTGSTENQVPFAYQASHFLDFGTGTGATRLDTWKTASQDLPRSELIGLGTNSYGQRHYLPASGPQPREAGYIGNLYIRALYDSGIIGLALLVLFLAGVLWPGDILLTPGTDLAPIAKAFVAGSIAMMIAFAATDALFQVWPWFFLGATRAARELVAAQRARAAAATS